MSSTKTEWQVVARRGETDEDVSTVETLGDDAYRVTFATAEEAQEVADRLAATAHRYGLEGVTYVVTEV